MVGVGIAAGSWSLSPRSRLVAPIQRSTLAVVLVALAVRAAHLVHVHGDVLYDVPVGDERLYLDWAARIADGDWASGDGTGPGLYHAPGHAWFLGALRALLGPSPWVWRVAQALLGAATAGLVGASARAAFGARAGLVAGLGYALFAPALFYEATACKAPLVLVLLAAAVLVLLRSRAARPAGEGAGSRGGYAVAFGLLLGGAELVQGIAPALLPLALLLRPGSPRRRLGGAGLALAGFALALVPLAARNAAAGEPLLQRTVSLGPNLWIGSGAGADGFYRPFRAGRGGPGTEREDGRRIAQRAAGGALSPAAVSAWWRSRALREMAADPAATLALLARKLGALAAAEEWTDSRAFRAHRERSAVLGVLAPLHFGAVAVLALASLAARWREDRARLVPFAAGAALLALGLAFFLVYGRLRILLAPFLLPLAADGALGLARGLAREPARAAAAAALVAAGIAATLVPDERNAHPVATTWTNAAAKLSQRGRPHEALALAREAVRRDPRSADAQLLLGTLLARTGDLAAGAGALRRAGELVPAYAFRAHVALAEAALEADDPAVARCALERAARSATDVPEELGRAGLAWRRLGEHGKARALYERALELAPDDPRLHVNLGWLEQLDGRPRAALRCYARALAIDPECAQAALNLAWLRASSASPEVRDGALALRLAERAAGLLGRDHPDALAVRAAALEQIRREGDAAAAGRAREASAEFPDRR